MLNDKKIVKSAKKYDLVSHNKWAAMYQKAEYYYKNSTRIPSSENVLQSWIYNQTRWMKQKLTDNQEYITQQTRERIRLLGLIGIVTVDPAENWQRKMINDNDEERGYLLKNTLIKKIDKLIEQLRIVHDESYIKVLLARANRKEEILNEEKRVLQETKDIYETLEPENSLSFTKSNEELMKSLKDEQRRIKEKLKMLCSDISMEDKPF